VRRNHLKEKLMRLSLKYLIATVVLVGGIGQPNVVFAAPPSTAERPVDQQSGNAGRTAAERELRYAGLSLGDAFRQSLIDDDLDFAFSTLTDLGQASGDLSSVRYFNGVRAFARGDYGDAVTSLKDADTEDMMVAAVRTWSFVGQGKGGEAISTWDAYGDSGRKPFYATYRGLLAEQAGQTAMALRQYRIAASTGELLFNKDMAKRYAVLLVRGGKQRDALTMFDEVFGEANALDAGDTAFRNALVAKRPLAQDAITPQNAVSGMMSNFAQLRILARRMGPEPEGDDSKKEEKKLDPDATFIDDALTLRTALLINPRNEDVRFTLVGMFLELDEDEAARKTIEPITFGARVSGARVSGARVSGTRVNEARLSLANIYNSLENPKRGLEVLDMVPQAQRDENWWSSRSDMLTARGDYAGALAAARQCVAKANGRGDWAQDAAQVVLANALDNMGKRDEARTIARGLVTRLEKRNPIRGAAASLLIDDASTRDLGLAAARDSLTAFGADGRSKVAVGSALVRFPATRAEGIALIREGAAAYPRSPAVMNALGYSLVAYDLDLEEGFRLLQIAHAARPNSGAIMDSLGRATYKFGNFDEAQRLIEGAVALRLDSPDPEIYDNLGDIYWHQGRKDDARVQWRKAKAIGGSYQERDALEGKLRNGLTTPPPTRRDVPVSAEPGSV
jgi:tetratricopeptide (TPR) repeat protein